MLSHAPSPWVCTVQSITTYLPVLLPPELGHRQAIKKMASGRIVGILPNHYVHVLDLVSVIDN